jgi:hypothetical protein
MKDHPVPEKPLALNAKAAKASLRPITPLLSLAFLALCAWLIASCSNNGKKAASPTPSPTGDDRSFSNSSKRFERPPPFGSRFNND